MKQVLHTLVAFIICISCKAQPKNMVINDDNAEKRSVSTFTSVEVSNAITVYLSQGNEDAVAVSCNDASKTSKIITEVNNGTLKIYVENSFWGNSNLKVKAYVSIKNLQHLQASGASTVKIAQSINCNDIEIKASGASTINGKLNANKITINASGASTISIVGNSITAQLKASGASTIRGYDFVSKNCKLEASGASSINVTVNGELDAEARGASDIRYAGNPTHTNVNSTGASSIKHKN